MIRKKLAALVIAGAMMAATGVPVLAASQDVSVGSGEEIVYGNQGLTESIVDEESDIATYGITSGYVDSGKNKGYWIRGDKKIKGLKHVYSSYKNYKRKGAASVTSGTGVYVDGGYKSAGKMSKAYTRWTRSGVNKANYRYK